MRRVKKSKSFVLHYSFEALDADTNDFIGYFDEQDNVVSWQGVVLYRKGQYRLMDTDPYWSSR